MVQGMNAADSPARAAGETSYALRVIQGNSHIGMHSLFLHNVCADLGPCLQYDPRPLEERLRVPDKQDWKHMHSVNLFASHLPVQ